MLLFAGGVDIHCHIILEVFNLLDKVYVGYNIFLQVYACAPSTITAIGARTQYYKACNPSGYFLAKEKCVA